MTKGVRKEVILMEKLHNNKQYQTAPSARFSQQKGTPFFPRRNSPFIQLPAMTWYCTE